MSFARCKSQTDRQPVRVDHSMNFARTYLKITDWDRSAINVE